MGRGNVSDIHLRLLIERAEDALERFTTAMALQDQLSAARDQLNRRPANAADPAEPKRSAEPGGLADRGLADRGLIDRGLIDQGLIDRGLIDQDRPADLARRKG